MSQLKNMYLSAIIGLLSLMALTACNTIAGAGEDIEAGGEVISDTADDTKEAITE